MDTTEKFIELVLKGGVGAFALIACYLFYDGKLFGPKAVKEQLDVLKKQLGELTTENAALKLANAELLKSNEEWKQLSRDFMQAAAKAAWVVDPQAGPPPQHLLPGTP